jgi:hypothetical protein
MTSQLDSSFVPDQFTLELCPEAQGHFCMLWGAHGHGGYDSQIRGYVQGGQAMDQTFDLMAIYLDFDEARQSCDWRAMRSAVAALRQIRMEMHLSLDDERVLRAE